MKPVLVIAGLLALATPAAAQVDIGRPTAGWTYFHKAGADMAAHDTAVLDCIDQAMRAREFVSLGEWESSYGVLGVANPPTPIKSLAALADNRGRAANIENCMVVRGWSVMRLKPAEGEALAARPLAERRAVLAGWVGSEAPGGRLLRKWDNDIVVPSDSIWADNKIPPHPSLSVTAVTLPPQGPPPPKVKPARIPKEARPLTPLSQKEIAALGPTDTVLVIRMAQVKQIAGIGALDFLRLGPDGATPAWQDGRPAEFRVHNPGRLMTMPQGAVNDKVHVFKAPPGRWRLAGVGYDGPAISLCFGGPAFELKAGEALYLGSFMFGVPDQYIPDLDLAVVRQALAAPALTDRLKPAPYINGSTGPCGSLISYALEWPAHPYAPDYAAGSKVR